MTSSPETVSVAPETSFDHHSQEYADHWPEMLRNMNAVCPISHSKAWDGFYIATSAAAVTEIISDDATYSSCRAVEGVDKPTGIGLPPSPVGAVPIDLDPPAHTGYRALLDPMLTLQAAKGWEPFIRDVTTACIDSIIEKGHGDIVLDIANPLPAIFTCELMGLPTEDWRYYSEPMHEVVYTQPGSPEMAVVEAKLQVMGQKLYEVLLSRKTDPRDDLISTLVHSTYDGQPIPDDVVMEMLMLVLVGGVDTTTSLMANGLRWLADHPDERERLRTEPKLMRKAREEMLRYFTPVQGLARTVTRDTKLLGVDLQLGDRVFMSFAAANRDPELFTDPDKLIIDRGRNPHMTFGQGVHKCAGSNVARVELDVVFAEVLRRMPDYVIDEAASVRYPTVGTVNGWINMPFSYSPGEKQGSTFVM